MIHIDKNGNVIGSFDAPQGHGMAVDSKGFVYIGQNTVRKYDPKTGKVVGEVPRAPETETGGAAGAAEPTASQAHSGPRQRRAGRGIHHAAGRTRSAESRGAGGSGGGDRGFPRQVSADDADDRRRTRRDTPR